MAYQLQPADFVGTPPRYPSPDYEAMGTYTRVYVPDDDTVGYAVLQGEALAWLSAVDPDHLGYGIRRHVSRLLRDNARLGVPVTATWDQLLKDTLHTMPRDDYLPALIAEIRHLWE